MNLEFVRVELPNLIQEATLMTKPLLEKNHNIFELEYDGRLTWIKTDPTKVKQILFNLLSNAAKFTHKGRVKLTVCLLKDSQATTSTTLMPETSDASEWICIQVSDTGIGIQPEQQQHLFEAFTQGDASTTRKYGGTGLGLTISHHFCKMMGGEISVESTLGQGSTFTVRLPFLREDQVV